MPFVPVTPSISSATADGFTITVNADGNPTPPATYYAFKILIGSNPFWVDALGHLSLTPVFLPLLTIAVTGSTANTLHSVMLSAADDGLGTNQTSLGANATVTTLAAQPLATAFTNVQSTTIMAHWNVNGNPVGTEFEVQISTDASFVTGITSSGWITDAAFMFTNLVPTLTYFARVRARNTGLALTNFTSLGSASTLTGPDTVKVIRVFNLLAERGYLITWQQNQETNIVSYNVYRSSSPTDDASFEKLGSTTPPVVSFLDQVPYTFGLVFYYKVTAIDDGGNESSLRLTTPSHENTYHSFEEQPFINAVSAADFVVDEIPSGVIDTVNTVFTTAFPYQKGSVEVYLNGVKQLRVIHFAEGPQSQQITFTDPPDAGGFIRINYKKFGGGA